MELKIKSGKKSAGFNSRQKKPGRFLTKRGVNLAANNDARNKTMTLAIGGAVILVLVIVVAKFGVIDLYAKQDAAEASYEAIRVQNDAMKAQLENYDEVLLEYRTYSMDWMENDTSGKYVSVDRQEILNMIEKKMMAKGQVTNVTISGETVEVEMQGMDLKQISDMCAQLEEVDIVKTATLENASTISSGDTASETEDGEEEAGEPKTEEERSDNLTFLILIELQPKRAETAEAAETEG